MKTLKLLLCMLLLPAAEALAEALFNTTTLPDSPSNAALTAAPPTL